MNDEERARRIEEKILEELGQIPDNLLMEALMLRHRNVIVIMERRNPVPDDLEVGLGVYLRDTKQETVQRAYQLLEVAQAFTVHQQQSGEYNEEQ
jgi:hypothetical protein